MACHGMRVAPLAALVRESQVGRWYFDGTMVLSTIRPLRRVTFKHVSSAIVVISLIRVAPKGKAQGARHRLYLVGSSVKSSRNTMMFNATRKLTGPSSRHESRYYLAPYTRRGAATIQLHLLYSCVKRSV